MADQLDLFAPVADVPFETDHARGVYFWVSGSGSSERTLSSHPHPRLPHFCAVHRTYSDKACNADHSPDAVKRREELFAVPVKRRAG